MANTMEVMDVAAPIQAGWDYVDYDTELGYRILGRIVPDAQGTMGVVYRVETLDSVRVLDGHVAWADIQTQIFLLPPAERGGGGTDRAVKAAIRADSQTRQSQLETPAVG
jgi:hypothetical protein